MTDRNLTSNITPHGRKLDLRDDADRPAMVKVLAENQIFMKTDVLRFVSSKLSEDWLVAWASGMFNIRTSLRGTSGIGVKVWAELVQSIYDMQAVAGIEEQIRRLSIHSHEALDTCLVLRIAGRYTRAGFSVRFEANGNGCGDLLIQKDSQRFYVEIKRENEHDHKRFISIQRCSDEILATLEPQIRPWLEDRNLRVEIKFSRSFSSGSVPAITNEIVQQIVACEVGKECVLRNMRDARYILLRRESPPHFQKGIHKGSIRVKQPGRPVPISPENMPVRIIFNWLPNLGALKGRVQKASRQLKNDADRDPGSRGFFVMQVSLGEPAKEAIIHRYLSSLPVNCEGIVLLSDRNFLIPVSELSNETVETMAVAARV